MKFQVIYEIKTEKTLKSLLIQAKEFSDNEGCDLRILAKHDKRTEWQDITETQYFAEMINEL